MFWFCGHETCGILALQPGIEPTAPALEGKILTTGLLGKSIILFLFLFLMAIIIGEWEQKPR